MNSTTASTTSISTIHPNILQTHILTRLDGPALVSTACASTELNSLASLQELWTNICKSTWPSTNTPRINHIISQFPYGPRSFFSQSFPLPIGPVVPSPLNHGRTTELISAVDIYYKNELIFSKAVETETVSAWFLCSPFRIDMLDPKDKCPTPIPKLGPENTCHDLIGDLSLSWILIDPTQFQAVNLSSFKPLTVEKHWLSGEVHARFPVILEGGNRGSASECVQCGIVVTCMSGAQGEGLQLREVSLQVEDMDGVFLTGKASLGILSRVFRGRKGISGRRETEGRRRYEEFLERKRVRKERKIRNEGTLDLLCVVLGVVVFAFTGFFLSFR